MIRNSYPSDVLLYQNIVTIPVALFPGFLYHFTTTYLNKPHRKVAVSIYGYCLLSLVGLATVGGTAQEVGLDERRQISWCAITPSRE
jgi:hypothetical protein